MRAQIFKFGNLFKISFKNYVGKEMSFQGLAYHIAQLRFPHRFVDAVALRCSVMNEDQRPALLGLARRIELGEDSSFPSSMGLLPPGNPCFFMPSPIAWRRARKLQGPRGKAQNDPVVRRTTPQSFVLKIDNFHGQSCIAEYQKD